MDEANLRILSGLSDGQVLQRRGGSGAQVTITGWSSKRGILRAKIVTSRGVLKEWRNRVLARIAPGAFTVNMGGIPAGGSYRLELSCGINRVVVRSFFVGDVWLLAGQSNMQGYGNRAGAAKPHRRIRAFSMRREWRLATDPLHVLEESPDACHTPEPCSPETGEVLRRRAEKGVGVGIFFARQMMRRSNVPQGLMCTAHGGTTMAQWDPALKHQGGDSLYGSMLRSVEATGQPIAGVLWYQGEGDGFPDHVDSYTAAMVNLVASVRRDLRQASLPWIMAQIGRLFAAPNPPLAWNGIQEQQRMLPHQIKNLATVASIDLPLDDLVHIASDGFPRLADRMARAADRLVYGNRREKRPPQLGRILIESTPKVEGGFFGLLIKVSFHDVEGRLQSIGEPQGFCLLDEKGEPLPYIYRTTLKEKSAHLHLASTVVISTKGGWLSYGHGLAPTCNITDARGFAIPVFGPVALFNGP